MPNELSIITTGAHATAEPVDFEAITDRLRTQLKPRAFEHVHKIRTAEDPLRWVRGGARNIVVDITSRLMRRTMRVESILEAAWAKVISEDERTLEIYEQATEIHFTHTTAGNETYAVGEVIDLFIVRRGETHVDELELVAASCMRIDELETLAKTQPWRYVHDDDGWRDVALRSYLDKLGIRHEIWTDDAAIDIVLKNVEYTQSYRTRPIDVDVTMRQQILDWVAAHPGDTAKSLYEGIPNASADDLLQIIVNGDGVFCDELRELLAQPWRLHLYPSPLLVRTLGRLPRPAPLESSALDLTRGGQFRFGESVWTVLENAGDVLLCKDGSGGLHRLSRRSLEDEFLKGDVLRAVPREPASPVAQIARLTGKAEERLIKLSELVLRIERGDRPVLKRGEQERIEEYRRLVSSGQDGRAAFIAGWNRCGRWGSRIDDRERKLVEDVLAREYTRPGAKGSGGAYAL